MRNQLLFISFWYLPYFDVSGNWNCVDSLLAAISIDLGNADGLLSLP